MLCFFLVKAVDDGNCRPALLEKVALVVPPSFSPFFYRAFPKYLEGKQGVPDFLGARLVSHPQV